MEDLVDEAIESLHEIEARHELSIVKLSEPLLAPELSRENNANRSSDASSTWENTSTAALEADLVHYKELFTKLRFSYVEQVTKEKFLRAIVGDPTLYVEPSATAALEASLVDMKVALKTQKVEVAQKIEELERQGRQLSKQHQSIQQRTEELRLMPKAIVSLQTTIDSINASQAFNGDNTSLSLPLPATLTVLSERRHELDKLNQQYEGLQRELREKTGQVRQLQAGLEEKQKQKSEAVAAATEARLRKEGSVSGGEELELTGRWLQGVSTTLERLLELKA